MVSADGSSQSFGGLTAQIGWFGLRVGGHPALNLHSSNEPGELSQWLCHDDSTINIVVVINIIWRVADREDIAAAKDACGPLSAVPEVQNNLYYYKGST